MVPAADAVRPSMRQHNGLLAIRIPFPVADTKQSGFNELHVHVNLNEDLSEQWPAQAGHELKVFKDSAVFGFVPLRRRGNVHEFGAGLHLAFIAIHGKVAVFVTVTIELHPFADRQHILHRDIAVIGQHPDSGVAVFVLHQRGSVNQHRVPVLASKISPFSQGWQR